MTEKLLGRSVNRLEDERFVRGRGRYVADLVAPNALHGVVVRSPHAHARIMAIDADAARQMPGVAAVLTGQELAADNIGPLPCAVTSVPMTTPLVVPPCHALARDVVRYVGEPVAFVVAESVRPRAMPPRPSSSIMRRCRRWSRSRMPFCRTPRRSGRRRGATSRSSSTAARSARWKPRSAAPPMSWNANWSTTASSQRRWRHAVRWASSTPRAAVCT